MVKLQRQQIKFLNNYFKKFNSVQSIQASSKFRSELIRWIQVSLQINDFVIAQVLSQLIPKQDGLLPNGFETIGTIAHLNLKTNMLPYKSIIGQAILRVSSYSKIEFTLEMPQYQNSCQQNRQDNSSVSILRNGSPCWIRELLNRNCERLQFYFGFVQNQGGIRMQLDLSKVYWCSKLQSERDRLLKMIKKNEVICDMFCGIGPFAIRAAKKLNCKVLANDLNPKCFQYLNKNIKKNKVTKNVYGFNLDARAFIKCLASKASINQVLESLPNNQDEQKDEQIQQQQSKEKFLIPKQFLHFDHVYMNLPADALEFLDVFDGIFKHSDPDIWSQSNLPLIHIYGFSTMPTQQEAKEEFIQRINKAVNKIDAVKIDAIIDFHRIKDISSISRMYSISFRLPKQVAFHIENQIPQSLSPEILKKKII